MRVSSTLLPLAALPLLARAAFHSNDTACTRHYTVEAGDTCDKIGQKTLTSTYQILAFNLLNAGADCYTLEIGSRLCLGRYGNDCQFVHKCSNSDTCESIANAYGISTHRLQDNNPSLDCNVVYDGLMLCVSAGSIRPPADRTINSTDVKAAREMARQAWVAQERQNASTKDKHKSSLPAPSASKEHSTHAKPHRKQADAKKQNQHSKAGKQKKSPDTRQHIAQPAAQSSGSHSQHTASQHIESHTESHNELHQAETHQTESHRTESHHTGSNGPKSTHEQHDPSAQSASMDTLEDMVDGIFAARPAGSNHTPHSNDHKSLPPPAGASNTAHKRHRSFSSRSHHESSHTH